MSKFATGVTVVTTIDDRDQVHAMTANAVTSVCLEPPLVLVCVAHSTNTYGFVEQRGRFGINILGSDQESIGAYYARKPKDRHGDVESSFLNSDGGSPVLEGALAFLGCKVVGSHVHGDHTIYVAEVEELSRAESGEPLLFFDSRFNTLGDSKYKSFESSAKGSLFLF